MVLFNTDWGVNQLQLCFILGADHHLHTVVVHGHPVQGECLQGWGEGRQKHPRYFKSGQDTQVYV